MSFISKGGRFESRKPKKKKGMKIFLTILLVLVLLIGAVAGVGIYFYKDMIGKINIVEVEDKEYTMSDELLAMMGTEPPTEATEATQAPTTEPAPTVEQTTAPTEPDTIKPEDILNVLVVGQSYREGEDSRLADTMILVTVNKKTAEVTLTSFLRDTYVDLPNYKGHSCGWNRINTNYALGYVWGGTGGAMEMTNLCIKNNFGIEVDYNVEINLDAFPKIIDILGGVRIELTQEEADYINEMYHNKGKHWLQEVEPGENRLFGETALEYARMRKAQGDSDSDIKRTARQRNLMTAIFEKLMSKGVPVIQEMFDQILPMVTTNMPADKITPTVMELIPLLPDISISSGTCPAAGTYWGEDKETPDGWANVLCFASGDQKAIFMPITEGITP